MAELMLINPHKYRRKAKKSSVKRRGKRRMSALQHKYFGKRKHKRTATVAKKRKSMSKKAIRARSRFRAAQMLGSPSRRYRRNPNGGRFNMQTFTRNTLMPSAVGAAGALGIDVIMGFLPLPPALKTGPMRTVVKIAGAIGIGMLAATFVKKNTAEQIAAGAITVALYDTLKGMLQVAMPTLQLGENDIFTEYPSLAYAGAGQTVDDMGAYVDDDMGMYVGDTDVVEQY